MYMIIFTSRVHVHKILNEVLIGLLIILQSVTARIGTLVGVYRSTCLQRNTIQERVICIQQRRAYIVTIVHMNTKG